jgi:hypothetical protein
VLYVRNCAIGERNVSSPSWISQLVLVSFRFRTLPKISGTNCGRCIDNWHQGPRVNYNSVDKTQDNILLFLTQIKDHNWTLIQPEELGETARFILRSTARGKGTGGCA